MNMMRHTHRTIREAMNFVQRQAIVDASQHRAPAFGTQVNSQEGGTCHRI
jgi:hypothetical protein